jgi:hypothetical protein
MYIISAFMGSCFAGASATSHAFLSFSVSVSSGENWPAGGGAAAPALALALALAAAVFVVESAVLACWPFLDGGACRFEKNFPTFFYF